MKRHFQYNWYKYLAVILLPILLWCFLFNLLSKPQNREQVRILFVGESLDVASLQIDLQVALPTLSAQPLKEITVMQAVPGALSFHEFLISQSFRYDILILSEACHDFWMPHEKGFLYQKETKAEINQLKKKYYPVIENHIYNYLVKESLTESEDHEIIQRDTVDWLCNNSEEIKNYIDDPRKMRAISCVVFECSVQFEHQPSRVGYCWGTYSLRK